MSEQTPEALEILYQDEYLVAINKPPGLLVHRSLLDKHETRFALQEVRNQIGQPVFPIHRLDKPTSGVLLFALSGETTAGVQALWDEQVEKRYWLICRGFTPLAGTIDHALVPKDDFKKRGGEKRPAKPAQEAITHYRRLATLMLDVCVDRYPQSRYSLVEATLETGRKHQIRRHFKHLAHPIIGCPKYGKSVHNRFFAESLGVNRLLLHSHSLTLNHPKTGQRLTIEAPLEPHFTQLLTSQPWVFDESDGCES